MIKLKDLLKEGESETVEFKPSLSQMEKITESISAFSNTNGGTVVIGVSDKGEVLGVNIGKNTMESLANQIKQNTDPMAYPSIRVEESDKKQVVVIEVVEAKQKPVLAFGRAFMRVGKSNQKLGFERIRNLAIETSKVHWDERVCEDASLEDLDEEKVRWFLKEARNKRGLDINENSPVEEALLRLKLLKAGKPTNGAVLLFAKDLQQRFIQSEVKCIRFKGLSVTGEMIDLRSVGGDVFDQLIEAEKFVFNNIALSARIEDKKIQRQERWEYPPKAIREVLANAISHRDYEIASKVQVRIFDDRMEFWNPGRLPEPEFELKETSFVVTFRKSKFTDEYLEQLGLNERQKKAISYIKEHGKIDRKTYCTICGVEKTLAHEELADMVNKELLDMAGTGKGIHYILRTKRTNSGRIENMDRENLFLNIGAMKAPVVENPQGFGMMNADLLIGHPHFITSLLLSKLKIMKTILINPPQNTKYPQPPLGLASIASVLEQKGHQVEIIDANALQLSDREIVEKVKGTL